MTDVLEKYQVDARTSSVVWSAFNCNSCNSVRGGPSTVPGADVGAGILSGAWRLAFFYDRTSSSLPVCSPRSSLFREARTRFCNVKGQKRQIKRPFF